MLDFIEIHILHSFPLVNLNRDDLNQPKDGVFGGARRARVSSQCLKRAIRTHPIFALTTQVDNGSRTRLIVRDLTERLIKLGKPEQESHALAVAFANAYSGGLDNKEHTKVLLYLSPQEIGYVLDRLVAQWDEAVRTLGQSQPADDGSDSDKKQKKGKKAKSDSGANPIVASIAAELLKQNKKRVTSAPDIALFGRMLAQDTSANLDAACQVAHAFSTHEVRKMDDDFFSAVDDLKRPEDSEDAGAAMIGNIAFTSACFYRYARLDWTQLKKNLQDDDLARRTVTAFLLASEAATPTGMKNSHDNHTRPSFLLAVARTANSPAWSLSNAFEKPVSGVGLVEGSIKKLGAQWERQLKVYGSDSVVGRAALITQADVSDDCLTESLREAQVESLNDWVLAMVNALRKE